MLSSKEARALATSVVSMTGADEAEVLVVAESSALTRFANNRINQNVAEDNVLVNVRAVLGKRVGVASTNRLDDASLKACADAAVASASVAPEDPWFPGLPEPESVLEAERHSAVVSAFDAEHRADYAAEIIDQSRVHGFTAAGKVRVSENTVAVANSKGIDVGMPISSVAATVLSIGDDGGTGWASYLGQDQGGLHPAKLGATAADIAKRSALPIDIAPGVLPVVLGPEAVADIMDFLGYVGFSAKAFDEGRSFLSNHLEDQVMSEYVTIVDDAISKHALGLTFDYEGVPKRRVPLIEYGVATMPVSDSYWANKTGFRDSGHALPAPNPYGPMPLNLEMLPGDATMEQLIESVDYGVYVTRFHYVNVEDPIPVTLTGMTRDGTFLIENGKLSRPLKNLRFTQPMLDALMDCEGVTSERRFVPTEEGASLVPGILLRHFNFTGRTTQT